MLEKIILEVLFQEPCHCISDDSEPTDNTDQPNKQTTARRNEETEGKLKAKIDSPYLLRRRKEK